jgi:hypothetical protein
MNERPNPIDAVVSAGRLYAAHLPVILPVIALLQAVKAAVLLGLIAALGQDFGGTLGWITSSILLASVDVVAARFAVDAHYGDVPSSPVELFRRVAPILPKLALFAAIGMLVTFRFAAPFGLPIYTQLVVFPAVAVFVVWLDAQHAKGDPAQEFSEAASAALALTRTALGAAVALLALQLFSLELTPALADSLVGRKAPLVLWSPVESVISTLVTPVVVMAIAGLYLHLRMWSGQSVAPAPAPVWPQIPGSPPST